MVSMNSIHFVRWTQQLKDSGHDVFWFDILDGGRAENLPWVHQISGWKQKYSNFKGRYFLKKRVPFLYRKLSFLFEHNTEKVFESILKDIKPDMVHSFILQKSCLPILENMKRHRDIKWVYSSWGSDLYNKNNKPNYKLELKSVLSEVDYLFTDCKRDYNISIEYGFKGDFLGVFPGGGGFKYTEYEAEYIKPLNERRIILVKGYQGDLGRSITVLKALSLLTDELKNRKVVVFGADEEVQRYINGNKKFSEFEIQVFPKKDFLPHEEILKLMGKALIYIGNSVSDGMPNTLLEAIVMGAFPIQSNPGNATEEVIMHQKNGLLISNCEDVIHIKNLILIASNSSGLIEAAFRTNQNDLKPKFEYERLKNHVLKAYKTIEV